MALDLAEGPAAVATEVEHAALRGPDRHPRCADGHVTLRADELIGFPPVATRRQPLVVLGPLLAVMQDRVRLVEFCHPTRRLGTPINIRVEALGKLAIDNADDLLIGVLSEHENLVVGVARVGRRHAQSACSEFIGAIVACAVQPEGTH